MCSWRHLPGSFDASVFFDEAFSSEKLLLSARNQLTGECSPGRVFFKKKSSAGVIKRFEKNLGKMCPSYRVLCPTHFTRPAATSTESLPNYRRVNFSIFLWALERWRRRTPKKETTNKKKCTKIGREGHESNMSITISTT